MSTTFTRVPHLFRMPNHNLIFRRHLSVLVEDALLVGEMAMEWCHQSRPSLLQYNKLHSDHFYHSQWPLWYVSNRSLPIYCVRGAPLPCSLECKIKRIHGQMRQESILQTLASKVLSLRNHWDNHFFGLERFVSYKEKEKMGDEEWCIRQPNCITIRWLHLNSILQTLQRKRPCRALAKCIHSVHYTHF